MNSLIFDAVLTDCVEVISAVVAEAGGPRWHLLGCVSSWTDQIFSIL